MRTNEDFRLIPMRRIKVSEFNVRKMNPKEKLEELKESIEELGLLQPIVVIEYESDKFEVVVGQRRFNALKELRVEQVPAIILKESTPEKQKIISLSENLHRVDLNRADVTDVIAFLYKNYKNVKKVARLLGVSVPLVYDYLRIQYAPNEIKEMLKEKKITKEDVKRVMLAAGDNKHKMINLAKEIGTLTKPEKMRLVDAGLKKPAASKEELLDEAKRPKIEEKVIVPLTPILAKALNDASTAIELEKEEIAKMALEEWLSKEGYYKKLI
ncbi:MAG: ParB/RepB/Spo0J family partition protein [Nitrospirota bacterium]